jgi:hypothetical protein
LLLLLLLLLPPFLQGGKGRRPVLRRLRFRVRGRAQLVDGVEQGRVRVGGEEVPDDGLVLRGAEAAGAVDERAPGAEEAEAVAVGDNAEGGW